MILKISQNLREKPLLETIGKHRPVCNFIQNETLAQVFSYKFWEVVKVNLFTERLRTITSHRCIPGNIQDM